MGGFVQANSQFRQGRRLLTYRGKAVEQAHLKYSRPAVGRRGRFYPTWKSRDIHKTHAKHKSHEVCRSGCLQPDRECERKGADEDVCRPRNIELRLSVAESGIVKRESPERRKAVRHTKCVWWGAGIRSERQLEWGDQLSAPEALGDKQPDEDGYRTNLPSGTVTGGRVIIRLS